MKGSKVRLTLYRWAGKKLFFEIRSGCEECDSSVRLIRDLVKDEFRDAPIQFKIRNWLDHLFECLLHGGWHPPLILINGRRFSQGVIPRGERLAAAIQKALEERYPTCPGCGRLVFDDYFAHRESETQARILRFIRQEHPEWVQTDGVCQRCLSFLEQKIRSGSLIA